MKTLYIILSLLILPNLTVAQTNTINDKEIIVANHEVPNPHLNDIRFLNEVIGSASLELEQELLSSQEMAETTTVIQEKVNFIHHLSDSLVKISNQYVNPDKSHTKSILATTGQECMELASTDNSPIDYFEIYLIALIFISLIATLYLVKKLKSIWKDYDKVDLNTYTKVENVKNQLVHT